MQIHQNSQKSGLARDFEGKGACRQIFEDDDDENQLEQQVSPNFKKIWKKWVDFNLFFILFFWCFYDDHIMSCDWPKG